MHRALPGSRFGRLGMSRSIPLILSLSKGEGAMRESPGKIYFRAMLQRTTG
jgi:hypothetical protein